MKSDFIVALTQLAAERNLPREVVLSAIEAALVSAYRKDNVTAGQNISVRLDPGSGDVFVNVLKTVAEEVEDSQLEITLDDARKIDSSAEVGGTVITETFPHSAGRIAAQTAKQVVMQRLREAEREIIFQEYADREEEVFSVSVQRLEPKQIIVDLGRAEAVLPFSEQVPSERYRAGQKMKVLLKEVGRSVKGPELIVSRADKLLLKRLFEMEVPEIFNGAVEIVAIAREPGSRSKVAVRAKQAGVDPVGSCVGLRGVRIQNIVNELHGEKIDVMEWSKEPAIFIANALSPSQVMKVELRVDEEVAIAVVPERQLSLAIGKEGQNARLAARLTGWKVDIRGNVEYEAELAERPAPKPVVKKAVPEPEEVLDEAVVEAVGDIIAEAEETTATVETEPVVAEVEQAPVAEIVAEESTEIQTEEIVAEAEPVVAEPVESEVEAAEEEEPESEPVTEIEPLVAEVEDTPVEVPVPEPVTPLPERPAVRESSEDPWSLRRAREPEPGKIRFAEEIAGLRGGVTASRNRAGRERPNNQANKKRKAGGRRRRR